MGAFSIALKLKLKPGKLAGYREAHDNLWPGVADSMARNCVNMAIYMSGEEELFLHATAPSQEHWDRSRDDPELDRWNEAMTAYLETDSDGNIVLDPMEKVFGFGQFAD